VAADESVVLVGAPEKRAGQSAPPLLGQRGEEVVLLLEVCSRWWWPLERGREGLGLAGAKNPAAPVVVRGERRPKGGWGRVKGAARGERRLLACWMWAAAVLGAVMGVCAPMEVVEVA